jgi:hypothetical protein
MRMRINEAAFSATGIGPSGRLAVLGLVFRVARTLAANDQLEQLAAQLREDRVVPRALCQELLAITELIDDVFVDDGHAAFSEQPR